MTAFLRSLLLAAAAWLVLETVVPAPVQADDYWNGYWGWYDNTYRPYYSRYYARPYGGYYGPGYSYYGPGYYGSGYGAFGPRYYSGYGYYGSPASASPLARAAAEWPSDHCSSAGGRVGPLALKTSRTRAGSRIFLLPARLYFDQPRRHFRMQLASSR
jgi:hypothetical protein